MKKCCKNILIFSLAFCLFMVACPIDVNAADNPPEIMPLYTGILYINIEMEVSSTGYANPKTDVKVISGYTADVTLQICYDSGIVSYTWSDSGSGLISLNKGRFVTSGHTYYAQVQVVVYNSNGSVVNYITLKSNTVSY